jgi:hypothetical protein
MYTNRCLEVIFTSGVAIFELKLAFFLLTVSQGHDEHTSPNDAKNPNTTEVLLGFLEQSLVTLE